MPFIAALPPALLAAMAIVPSALSVASGIVKKDPLSIGLGLLGGATAGLGGFAGLGATAGKAALTGATAGASAGLVPAASSAASLVPSLGNISNQLSSTNRMGMAGGLGADTGIQIGINPSVASPGSGLNTANSILGGLATGATGVTSLIDALRSKGGGGGRILGGGLEAGLSPFYGANAGNLPGVPNSQVPQGAETPNYKFKNIPANETLLELLQAFRG